MKKAILLLSITFLLLATYACGAVKPGTVTEHAVDEAMNALITEEIIRTEQQYYDASEYFEEAHEVLGVREGDLNGKDEDTCLSVFIVTLYGGYNKTDDGYEEVGGGFHPAAVVLKKSADGWYVNEYRVPRDGDYHVEDVKAIFSEEAFAAWQSIEESAESHNQTVTALQAVIQEKLEAHTS